MDAIPLSFTGIRTTVNSVYEDIENYQPKNPPMSTSEFGDIKTATCPAYMPLMHRNQTPTYDIPRPHQNQPPSDVDTYDIPRTHQNQPPSDAGTYVSTMLQSRPQTDADTYEEMWNNYELDFV